MPLTFDMPLEELADYNGSNPRPADFDEFWDNGLAELAAVEPQVELEPAEFESALAETFHLYFSGTGGARVHAKMLRPKGTREPHPAVLLFHGYGSASKDWVTMLGYVAQGFSVAALDCRGQAGLSEDSGGVTGPTLEGHIIRGLADSPDKMLFRHIFLDTARLAQIMMAMPDVDEERVGVTGGSQGGGLTLACAALEPRIKLAAPLYPFLCDYRRVWDIDLAEEAYGELRNYFRNYDPLHENEAAIFEKLGYIDVQYLCPHIEAEVLLGVCLMDTICPPSTQFAAYNKIQAPKRTLLYPDFGHEVPPGHEDRVFRFLGRL